MLNIYKASAGAGKTFALTLEYFRIIFTMPSEYRSILAVTFTNKATEEMKSRIINELHKLAEGHPSSYGDILCKELKLDSLQLKNRAVLLRTMLLHDYGRLSVTTIDRFFQRIIKAFTQELGIFPGYNVELDSDFVLAKAVEGVMQRIRENIGLKTWVKELMDSNVEAGKSWSVKARIADLGAELFRENYMLFDKSVLDKFGDKTFLKQYSKFLQGITEDFEKGLSNLAKEAITSIQENGLQYSDFKSGKSGCVYWFYKLASGIYDAPTPTTRKGAVEDTAWFTQKSPCRAQIENICPFLMDKLRLALEYYDKGVVYYQSARQLSGNLYQLGILDDLHNEVRTYCNENGVMLLNDTTHILSLLIAGNDTSFLFEKYGNYYKHLMIDEFQDTSVMQWQNFRPLVINSLGEGGNVMIVGDVKQSIYRWRNGDWGLLATGVEQEFSHLGVNTVMLQDNWRSSHEIVEFNNEFFEEASVILADMYKQETDGQDNNADTITAAYKGLRQTPRKSDGGYVDIRFIDADRDEEGMQAVMESVVQEIKDIVNRKGMYKDVVILVRDGKEGAFVADFLMNYNKTADIPVPFISNDSLYIWSSPYVQFIVSVLRYLVQPDDSINKTVISYLYGTYVCKEEGRNLHTLFSASQSSDFGGLEYFLNSPVSSSVQSYSLYETIETIIDTFHLKSKVDEVPYLIAFQDVVYEYESNNSNSITLFLEWWDKEQKKRVLSTSEEINAVRILTIHKSKGLEFEFVLLPFCLWELDAVRPLRRIWCSNREKGFDTLECAPLDYSSRLSDTIFREDYLNEHLKAYIDNLNLLYVASTRAKTELYLRPFLPKTTKDGSLSGSDIGTFIYRVLSDMGKWQEEGVYTKGTKRMFTIKDEKGPTSFSLSEYPVWNYQDRVSIKYDYCDYIETEPKEVSAIDEGKLLHQIFKSIHYVDDVDQAIEFACMEGLIHREEVDEYRAKINGFLGQTGAASWFTSDCKVINEMDILFPNGNKVRPDRVVIIGDVVKIIDYKFGQLEETRYEKQVNFYCSTLKKMGYSKIEGYLWYVNLEKIIRVI